MKKYSFYLSGFLLVSSAVTLFTSCEGNNNRGTVTPPSGEEAVISAISSDAYVYTFEYDDLGRLASVRMEDLLFDGITESYFLEYEGDSIVRLTSDGYMEVFIYEIEDGRVTDMYVDVDEFPETEHMASYRYDQQGHLTYVDWPDGIRDNETYEWIDGNMTAVSGIEDETAELIYGDVRNMANLDFIYLISPGYLYETAELSIPNLMIVSGLMGTSSYNMPEMENVLYAGEVYQDIQYVYGTDESGRIVSVDIADHYGKNVGWITETRHVTIEYM